MWGLILCRDKRFSVLKDVHTGSGALLYNGYWKFFPGVKNE
jgi:hypothetical protein